MKQGFSSTITQLFGEIDVTDTKVNHFKALKYLGALVMVSLFATSLSINTRKCHCSAADCIRLTSNISHTFFNETQCKFLLSYNLSDDYQIHLCKTDKSVKLDLRHYINKRPTSEGVTLNVNEWDYLYRISGLINDKLSKLLRAHSPT